MTLTEFLLARITEDEDWANDRIAAGDHESRREHWCNGVLISLFVSPDDALSILAAKRESIADPVAGEHWSRLLAQAYTAHPDYDEAWRP